MVLERYRSGWDASLAPLARRMHAFGVTPNTITVVSLLFAIGAAAAFYLADDARPWLLVAGSAAVGLNAILDGLDGKLARLTNATSRRGDYLDHAIDRYSDVLILLGLAMSPFYGDLRWGILAIVGTLLTSYMGTQAQALGLGRNYAGFLGRADRLVILITVPILVWLSGATGILSQYAPYLVPGTLAYFAIVGNLTAVQRFWAGWKALELEAK